MLTESEKISQMLMVGFDGRRAPDYILQWLASGRIGGVYLFARNIESPAQVKRLAQSCHQAAKYPILVGIDQEGGAVARLRAGFSESPGAMALGAAGDARLAEEIAFMLGREMAALGINWNFAPVADIAHNKENPSIGTRSPGADKDLVRKMVLAQVKGFLRAGVAPTVKHFPGLGNTAIDTHEALAKATGSLRYLYEEDLIPFLGAIKADVPCIMTTHVMYEELDARYPATLSARVIEGLLRTQLGYEGLVCTDCMQMKAIANGWGAGESAVLAVLAGVDVLLFSHSRAKQEAARAALLHAAETGRIAPERIEQSLACIQAVKRRFPVSDAPPLEIVGCQAHRSLARAAARAGTVLLGAREALPIAHCHHSRRSRLLCIEFATQFFPDPADGANASASTVLSRALKRRLPNAQCLIVRFQAELDQALARARPLMAEADNVIIATRNAHVLPWQAQAVQVIVDRQPGTILLCLRNPYDADVITGAKVILCSHGDSAPSIEAAVAAICGDFKPAFKRESQ